LSPSLTKGGGIGYIREAKPLLDSPLSGVFKRSASPYRAGGWERKVKLKKGWGGEQRPRGWAGRKKATLSELAQEQARRIVNPVTIMI